MHRIVPVVSGQVPASVASRSGTRASPQGRRLPAMGHWILRLVLGTLAGLSATGAAQAQLNENCVVSVLNRNVQSKADGTWVLPNIPANFGELRARATCVNGGVTTYGESAPFTLSANGSVTLPPIVIGPTTPIPTSVRVTAPAATLTSLGATAQLAVQATYAGNNTPADVTGSVSYVVSNPAVATVSPTGLVTAVRSGVVVVQATKEGTMGLVSLRVAPSGVDSDGDGIPDEDEIRMGMDPNNAADALLDIDHDGLTALEEYRLGTEPRNPDTDGDGISDGDEAKCKSGFCTNPLLADTDGDGIRDLTEIRTGSDPTNPASTNLAAALASLRVSPASFTLVVNSLTGSASVQLTVTGVLIDGYEIDLTNTARGTTYSSSNVASCNFGSPDGRVYGSAAGTCDITVRAGGQTVVVPGTVQDFAPGALSYVAIPGYANGVAVSGDFAFVASGSTGLQVVSLSADRRTPAVVASLALGGSSNDVTLAGNFAYLATSAGLKVVDVSVPTTPRLLGTFAGVGNALGVKVRGTTAYVTGGSSLFIVSVANPGAMILAGSINLGGTAWNVELDPTRSLAAVAAGGAGLKLVDVSNLSAPILRGTASTPDARGVALRGTTAIVADYAASMTSVDIANLAAPRVLSSTPLDLGGRLTGVALSDYFALGADVLFVNGVPIVDVTNPGALAARAILNFPARDDNGMGIAVDNAFIYLATDHSGLDRGGSSGDSRLYIGQYQPRVDLAGVPPTATITAPANGQQVYEGAQLTVTVDAVDDVAVASVSFSVAGNVAYTTTTAPYQYTFTVPANISSLMLDAKVRDLGGNEGVATPVTVNVAPDPLTRVIGLVNGEDGQPVAGALVTAPGGRTATTGPDGRFEIVGVPTVLGNLVVQASYTPPGSFANTGSSAPIPPVLGGTTDVGAIGLLAVAIETNLGTLWTTCDDCYIQKTLPFAFNFYGQPQTTAFVGSNGYITFSQGDSTYTESVSAFSSLKRISLYFDDLIGGEGTWINDTLPDRFIVTYNNVMQCCSYGSRWMQMQLFRDGRIVFAYNGTSVIDSGNIVGLTPGPNSPFVQVDYSTTPSFDVPAATAVYEYFTAQSVFDLDRQFVVFTPTPSGGYSVRTIAAPRVTLASALTGSASAALQAQLQAQPTGAPGRNRAVSAQATWSPAAVANAEVLVQSSSNPAYRGMTNTDALGRFSLEGVPAGGVTVTVVRNGIVLARGSAVFKGGNLNQAQLLDIQLVDPAVPAKSVSGKSAVGR